MLFNAAILLNLIEEPKIHHTLDPQTLNAIGYSLPFMSHTVT